MRNVDAGDLNGDGTPDLVIAKGYDFNTVAVLFGRGDGTFGAPTELAVHLGPNAGNGSGAVGPDGILIADFNRDGRLQRGPRP